MEGWRVVGEIKDFFHTTHTYTSYNVSTVHTQPPGVALGLTRMSIYSLVAIIYLVVEFGTHRSFKKG